MSRRRSWLALVTFLAVAAWLAAAQSLTAESKGRVLIILRTSNPNYLELTDLMITKEAGVIKAMLSEAGFDVRVATPSGEPIKGLVESIQADLKLDDVQIGDFVGVVVPCLGSSDNPMPKAVEIVSQAYQLGKPLAAQYGGVFTLGAAGVLKGKRFACQPGDAHWISDGTYAGIGVVVDGKVVTSGTCPYMSKVLSKPDGTAELTNKFIALLL